MHSAASSVALQRNKAKKAGQGCTLSPLTTAQSLSAHSSRGPGPASVLKGAHLQVGVAWQGGGAGLWHDGNLCKGATAHRHRSAAARSRSGPLLQARQRGCVQGVPQLLGCGQQLQACAAPQPTLSPIFSDLTLAPTSTTVPDSSPPATKGSLAFSWYVPCARPAAACLHRARGMQTQAWTAGECAAAHLRLQRVGKVEAAGCHTDLHRTRVRQRGLGVAGVELQGLVLPRPCQGVAQLPDHHGPHGRPLPGRGQTRTG